ncbi:hypothetical protein ACFVKH_19085 [Almyronema epifaneia S1]|uniref:Uncharacterized protein n=1 Tax=Almyronema epifaneia S1 TaxID=2991925 RepID=A0ABW6ILG3_9CYAN
MAPPVAVEVASYGNTQTRQPMATSVAAATANNEAVIAEYQQLLAEYRQQLAAQRQQIEALQSIIQTLAEKEAVKYDLRGAQFGGGFAETVQGNQVGGVVK